MRTLQKILRGFFIESDTGSVSVEAILVMPILLWSYVSAFVFFDGFRTYNQNVKAAYTIGDMLSRETDEIDDDYLESLSDVFDYLTFERNTSYMRFTQVHWSDVDEAYSVDWSYATNGHNDDRLRTVDLLDIAHRLPPLVHGERIILVESFTTYVPVVDVGLSPSIEFRNFVPTSPRFAPMLAKS